jgi:hypothetical protein
MLAFETFWVYIDWKARDMIHNAKNGKITGNKYFKLFSFFSGFFKSFILKKGYKEGYLGLLIVFFGAFYPLMSFLKAKRQI